MKGRRNPNFKHGCADTPEYNVWYGMRQRCSYAKHSTYRLYGGRGIRVCDRWQHSFENFIADMGPRPSAEHSIDRIDNDGHYEPGNCRWALGRDQFRNMRTNRHLTLNGRTQTMVEWARELSMDVRTLHTRLKKGWTVERALTTPVDHRNTHPHHMSSKIEL
jgi:hypothetical protein